VPRVDFYILQDQNPPEKFACAIAGKIFRQGLKIHIHTDSREAAVTLDDFMWTYRDTSFLPHQLAGSSGQPDTSITIGWNEMFPGDSGVLINLGAEIPQFAANFARIIEIVAGYDPLRSQARDRYRQYRDLGYDMHKHDIDAKYADV